MAVPVSSIEHRASSPFWTPRPGQIRRRIHPSLRGILLAPDQRAALWRFERRCRRDCQQERMPGFERARRKTRPNLCGHSVGWLIKLAWCSLPFPGHEFRPDSSACASVRKCPGSGGPGVKPAQAVVGIRLVRKSVSPLVYSYKRNVLLLNHALSNHCAIYTATAPRGG
jgi:hypothetical protein